MSRRGHDGEKLADLDELLAKVTTDARGNDDTLRAFQRVFERDVALPSDGFVIGEPVSVTAIDYGGNTRRGLEARCRREDGSEHLIAAGDVVFPPGSPAARHVAAYRRWLGLDPHPAETTRRRREHKATAEDLDLSGPVELVALSVKERAVRCRLLRSDRAITFRASEFWDVVPGEILTVTPRKQWSYAGHPYLSGEIDSARLDARALGLVPLRLEDMGSWDPDEHYWGEPDDPIEEWAKPIIARGPRPALEMEQVLPGQDPDDPFVDPITRSNDLKDAGEWVGARKILMELCQADLRCLDAHAHLGNLVFDRRPEEAIRHYQVGVSIGEMSIGDRLEAVLPWGHVDNRPFLRCMHGYGLCLWRLGRYDEAGRVFEKLLWLNPSDNQGVRFLVDPVRAGERWEETHREAREGSR